MLEPGGLGKSLPGRAVIAAILLRVILVLLLRDAPALIDMGEYQKLAVSILEGRGYSTEAGPTAFRPPLYPLFLSLVYGVVGTPNILAARLIQAVLGGVEVWLTWRVALLLGLPAMASGAAWIVALYPTRFLYATFLHRETLLGILWLWQILAFLRVNASEKPVGRAVVAGITVALGALCNAVLFATSCALSAVLLFSDSERFLKPMLRRMALVGIIWVVGLGTLVPWGIRNQSTLGGWVWVNTKGGRALWEGNNPGWMDGKSEIRIRQEQWDAMADMSEVEAERFAKRQALAFIRHHPGQFLYLSWRRSLQFWRLELLPFFYYKQGYFGDLSGLLVLLLTPVFLLPFPVLLLAAAGGAVLQWRRSGVKLLAFLAAVYWLGTSLFIGGFRYHYPLVPGLAILAVLGWRDRARLVGRRFVLWVVLAALLVLNFADHVGANWNQVMALLGRGGALEYSETRSWMKKGPFLP